MGVRTLPEAAKPYAFTSENQPEGRGRPLGSQDKPKILPPIKVESLPFPVLQLKKGETVAEYWSRQSPITLKYLIARFDSYLIYAERGIPDPLGAQIFKLLGKEMVKTISKQASIHDKNKVSDKDDGKSIKAWRNKLIEVRQSLDMTDKEEESLVQPASDGEWSAVDMISPRVSDLPDDF